MFFGEMEKKMRISSPSNEKIKAVIQLQTKASVRKKQKLYVVEGTRMYEEVPENDLVATYLSEKGGKFFCFFCLTACFSWNTLAGKKYTEGVFKMKLKTYIFLVSALVMILAFPNKIYAKETFIDKRIHIMNIDLIKP